MRLLPAALLAVALVTAGCATPNDDELDRPTATETVTPRAPASTPAAAPRTVPVGAAAIAFDEPVWAQGSVLHVGEVRVDVAPRRLDAFAITRGGVYFLDDDELWFTDLAVVRATGFTGVTRVVADRGRAAIRVTTTSGSTAYDATSGRRVPARTVVPLTGAQRLGTSERIALRPERSDVSQPAGAVPVRTSGGGYGVVDVEGGPLVAVDTTSDQRVPLTGVVGREFELVTWTSRSAFYGLALDQGRPQAVLSCDLVARSCSSSGRVDPDSSPLFESGT